MMVKKNVKLAIGFSLFVCLVFFMNSFISAETGLNTNAVYDSRGNIIFKEIVDGDIRIGTPYYYDSFNRVTSIRSLDKEIKFTYSPEDSQPSSQTVFDFISNSHSVLNFSYSDGNKIVQDFEENGLMYKYNSQGRLTEFALGNYVYQFNTDQYGNVASSCVTSYSYVPKYSNKSNSSIQSNLSDQSSPYVLTNSSECTNYPLVYDGDKLMQDDTYSYEYSSDGKLKAKTIAGESRDEYYYDDLGNVTKKVFTDLVGGYSTIYYTLIPGDESSFVDSYDLEQIVSRNNFCEDSDGGVSYADSLFNFGHVFDEGIFYLDSCESGNKLREYYCTPQFWYFGDMVVGSTFETCEFGCLDGACLESLEQRTCSEMNGNICLANQTCSRQLGFASDGNCCFGTCNDVWELPPEPTQLV